MKRINDILNDPEYLLCVNRIRAAEADRIYCRHDPAHFLDVARLARIIALEENFDADKELLYAMGLLHDIGRHTEYENGTDHAIAGSKIAEKILARHGFTKTERETITEAIEDHRAGSAASPLADILYRADKLSRNCVLCDAAATCKRFQNGEKAFLLY
ncbi:MAG: HD domain-containing protein [Clostridiales Family XIII bacterium]|jgi:putative nucleotidyltransferase with HDIG domain|nr:HD domain-containing protein [Clostridiales Family XIII bacterium]